MTPKISQKEEPKEKPICDYMQAGRIIKCGHCDPEHFTTIEDAAKQMNIKNPPKCECICHDKPKEKVEIKERKDRPDCKTINGLLYCSCGKCKQEDYRLPEDFPKEKDIWAEFDELFLIKDVSEKAFTFVNQANIIQDTEPLKEWISQHFISKQELREELKGIKKEQWKIDELNSQRHSGRTEGFNQAIDEIIKKLK
jgi:hypothetical protein